MKTNKKLLSLIVLSMLLAKPYNVFAADADSFRTDEYYGMDADPISAKANKNGALDIINAAGAYAKGYTGKGVTVGVTDVGIVNFSHPEFSGKTGSGVVFDGLESSDVPLTWEKIGHPTHVAGIAAADKNGFGMHGVAYDADIASSSAIGHYYGGLRFESCSSFYDYYLTNPDIKIINNSWGSSLYLLDEKDFNEGIAYFQSDIASFEIEKAVNNDKLLVFSAGNDGKLAAALESNLDILTGDKAFNDNIITVTAVKANSFKKNNNGGFDVESDAIAIFSNLAMYNEDTTLSAPGWNINSTYADFDASGKYYKDDSGTSMAAPMVTGVGALVQQAFPYLNAKQIGDVLLSTANNNITNDSGYFINYRWEYGENGQLNDYYNILLTGKEDDLENNGWKKLYDYLKNNRETAINYFFEGYERDWEFYFGENGDVKLADEFKEKYKNILGGEPYINVYQNVPLDVIFGQGIVDAGKSVNGLGAINVRRLDKSDISSDYTVAGVNGKTKQALYKVDTQGYNSVWSNDIGEIRAGYIAENPLGNENTNFDGADSDIKDLHDRWVFYTTNSFDDNPTDSKDHNWMTNHYMQQYNQQVTDSELAGLHAGLYKTGEGILALAGDNTYKGASIAAGGTLQIDGRVAGDVYSEGAGTIAGSGKINGDLYNNGAVEAGSWGAVTDKDGNALKLTVNGKLDGNGVIAVNTDGKQYGIINVEGEADVSGMRLKAGTFAAPGVTGTILTVGKNDDNSIVKTLAITDTENSITGAESLNTDFSGMLNGKVTNTGTKLELTTSISNNAGINGARFNAFNSLYNNLTKAEQQEMQRLYALNNNSLNNAVNELSQSESMHMELARDAIQNRDVRQAVSSQQHLDRDEGLWAITGKNWGETDGGITRHSYNLTLGKDFYNSDNTYAGALFAYSDNSIGGNSADGEYKNYSLGIYGGSKNSPGTVTGYVSYGVQDNELTRHLGSAFSHSGMGSKLESDYDSSVIGVGAKYAYDLHYGKEGWHVSPYAALDYAHYKQDSFTERGSVFGVYSGGFSDNYLTGELGFDFNRTDDNGKYGFSLSYKRILDGETLDADFAFAKGGNGFGVQSIDGSKNHVVATAYISTKLSDKWEIGGTLLHDWSSTDRDLSAAVNLNYYF